ncbi:MAG: hypothetical protein Fur003_1690 [Candidatus Dojkabacteria bacterium]
MAVDLKGIFKDNQKLFLSMAAVIILILMIPFSDNAGWFDLNINNSGTLAPTDNNNNSGNTSQPTAVNNGNSDKYKSQGAPANSLQSSVDYQAEIITSKGTITIDLYEDDTPLTVNNFVFLAKQGFYTQSSFHRIAENFVIQGGDPLGNGTGGPGYTFADEIRSYITFAPYSVAMANSGPNTNGSQFFITTRLSSNTTNHLNGSHTIFGKVIDGFEIVDAIEKVSVKTDEPNKYMPYAPVYINSVNIVQK